MSSRGKPTTKSPSKSPSKGRCRSTSGSKNTKRKKGRVSSKRTRSKSGGRADRSKSPRKSRPHRSRSQSRSRSRTARRSKTTSEVELGKPKRMKSNSSKPSKAKPKGRSGSKCKSKSRSRSSSAKYPRGRGSSSGAGSSKTPSAPEPDVELLPTPVKSPVDENLYRAIKLKNGLRAILVEDREFASPDSDEDEKDDEDNEDANCIDVHVGKFNLEVLGLMKQDLCHCMKPDVPKKKYKNKRKRPLEKPKRKDKEDKNRNMCELGYANSDLASFALSVGAGSYDEPNDLLGLAHLTEHCVFIGSEKYPKSDTLDKFLSTHGGQILGNTDGNNTTFAFSVQCNHLPDALRIFVESLKRPLLRPSDVAKERDTAVDTEFQDKRTDDGFARIELLQTMAKKGNPVARFGWGTKETLQTRDKRDETLAARLRTFFDEHYTVDNMTVAIQSPCKLDTLQNLVVEIFGGLQSRPTPSPSRGRTRSSTSDSNSKPQRGKITDRIPKHLRDPYNTKEFRMWYNMVPHKTDATKLIVTWCLPPIDHRTKTLLLAGHYIDNEYEHGLAHYLRSKYWIKSIKAQPGKSSNEYNEVFTLFAVTFVLTKRGDANHDAILEALFSYINFLRRLGQQNWHCTEMKELTAIEFHFNDQLRDDPVEFCKILAKELNMFGSEDVIGGGILMYEENAKQLGKLLDMLTPNTANFMYISKKTDNCFRIEPYFKTKYGVIDVPHALMARMDKAFSSSSASYVADFRPFGPNKFLTTNFCPVKNPNALPGESEPDEDEDDNMDDTDDGVSPRYVVDTERFEFWHKYDEEMAADAIYKLELISPVPLQSCQNSALMDLWIYLLEWDLKPLTQIAKIAHLEFSIYRSYRGVFIDVEGLSQKLKLLLDDILKQIAKIKDNFTEDAFNMGKHGQLKEYVNVMMQSDKLCGSLKNALTSQFYCIENNLYDELNSVTYDTFRNFSKDFLSELYVLCLAQGNVHVAGVIELRNDFLRILDFKPVLYKDLPDMRAVKLPLGETIARVLNTDRMDNNATIIHVYQIESQTMTSHALVYFISDQLYDPAFQVLRVREGLGYDVTVDCAITNCILELTIQVQTHSDQFTANYVKNRIDLFMLNFYCDTFSKMTPSEYKSRLSSYGSRDGVPENNWNEIKAASYTFDRNDVELLDILEKFNLNKVKEFYKTYFLPGEASKMRKLSVQVVGEADREYRQEYVECKQCIVETHGIPKSETSRKTSCHAGDESSKSAYPLVMLRPTKKQDSGAPIVVSNIEEFKNKMPTYGIKRF